MLKKLLMTGAAGGVGKSLRPLLHRLAEQVLLSDIAEIDDLSPHETFRRCDLGDRAQVGALFEGGVDGVLHLGGISLEKPFEQILNGNIVGVYNLFEAARHHDMPRIIFASSNHVTGFYTRHERVDPAMPVRPDSLYGVSKVFGEGIASLYFDKFGQECLSIRIGWCFPKPINPRTQAIWLGVKDLFDLCERGFTAPRVGHTIIYGVSDNEEMWWDNSAVAFLGWKPRQSSAKWRSDVLTNMKLEKPTDPDVIYQGGHFATSKHPNDE